jgi:hypothetical protein
MSSGCWCAGADFPGQEFGVKPCPDNRSRYSGVRDPLGQDEIRNRGDVDVNALEHRGRVEIKAQNDRDVGEVKASQFADPRSMPSLAPAVRAYLQAMRNASDEVQRKEGEMYLDQGITTVANALYQNRQRGLLTTLLNTYGFGIGSASPQEYAEKLHEAAAKDPELARGLATIGMNHVQAKIAPTEKNLEWVVHQAGQSVANAEGTVSTLLYHAGQPWRWVKGLFGEPEAQSTPGSPQPAGGVGGRPDVLKQAWGLGEQTAADLFGGTPGGSNWGSLLGGGRPPAQGQPQQTEGSSGKKDDTPPPRGR